MRVAVVREASEGVELVGEFEAGLMNPGIPDSRRIAGSAGGGAVETGKPLPLDLVAHFHGEGGGRKRIFGTDTNAKFFGRCRMGKKAKESSTQKSDAAEEKEVFHAQSLIRFHFYPGCRGRPLSKSNTVVTIQILPP